MFRTIGKWLIDRAIEREAPLPRWLRRWVDRDVDLARFEAASRRLPDLLRSDATTWTARPADEVRTVRRPAAAAPARRRTTAWTGRRIAGALAAGALAASALLALAWRQTAHDNATSPQPSTSRQLANDAQPSRGAVISISPSERQQLMAAWQASRANLSAWQSRWKAASRRIEAPQLSDAAPRIPRVKIADAATKRLRTALDAAVTSHRQDLAAQATSAYTFFAHRLPSSIARLVGLQDG